VVQARIGFCEIYLMIHKLKPLDLAPAQERDGCQDDRDVD